LNAVKNILDEGSRIDNISVGTTDYGHGAQIRHPKQKTRNHKEKNYILAKD
jgi:hypothetical protein